ncbi:MAG: hypothetical protein AAF253_01425 [Pseudomonadota bacterium]
MSDRSRPDPIGHRWQPVSDVFPIFINLVRASWRQLLAIWGLVTGGVLTLSSVLAALPVPPLVFLGVTPAILPVAFGSAMAAHRLLWPSAPRLAACADVAMRAFIPLLVVIAMRQVLMQLGFSMLVLPGLAAAVFLLLAPVVVMAEGPGLQNAFQRSATLILPIGWAVLGLLFLSALSGLLLLVPIALVAVPLAALGEGTLEAFVEAGATAAFPLAFTTMGVAIYLYVTGAGETRH